MSEHNALIEDIAAADDLSVDQKRQLERHLSKDTRIAAFIEEYNEDLTVRLLQRFTILQVRFVIEVQNLKWALLVGSLLVADILLHFSNAHKWHARVISPHLRHCPTMFFDES